jgi:hypothetical protein
MCERSEEGVAMLEGCRQPLRFPAHIALIAIAFLGVRATDVAASTTPGVTLNIVERSSSLCASFDQHIDEIQQLIWLRWVAKSRARRPEKRHVIVARDYRRLGSSPLEELSLVEQKHIWDSWTGRVIIDLRNCTERSHPVPPTDSSRGGCDLTIRESGGNQLVDLAAIEALVTSGSRQQPPVCNEGAYTLEVFFSSWRDKKVVIERVRQALMSDSAEIRVLAAEALGAMGHDASPAIHDLERAQRDPVESVREAVEDALDTIRQQ